MNKESVQATNRPAFSKNNFGGDFHWGVSSSALQTEGAWNMDGKGPSNWDVFSKKRRKILNRDTPETACDFYNRYAEDLSLIRSMQIPHFRFSISWSRLFPEGTGMLNQKGIDFYNNLIDTCLENNITPWVTLYHWDLPQALESKGGWTNRDILGWFENYVRQCMKLFGDRVKHWMVLNEPMVFTGAGYYLGVHAPGKKRMRNFLPALHHAILCQALGTRVIREECPEARTGTTFSCSYITPYTSSVKDAAAAHRIDTLLNRLFLEPALGMGYPFQDLNFLNRLDKYIQPGDEQLMKADLDFIGIQVYTREVVRHSRFIPFLKARPVPAAKRKVYHTTTNWEVYPEAIYEMLKKYSSYPEVKKIIVTENGAAFHDEVNGNSVNDDERIHFLSHYLEQVKRAKDDGYKVDGYFAWSLTDNFEWAEGYVPRFGLVYVDYKTQQRIIKDSGLWYGNFLSEQK